MFGKNDYQEEEVSFWEDKEGAPQRHCLREGMPLLVVPAVFGSPVEVD